MASPVTDRSCFGYKSAFVSIDPETPLQQKRLFLAGILAGPIFFTAVYVLASMLDGYSHVSQTVSEIGWKESPVRVYHQAALLIVATCLVIFAVGLYRFAASHGVPRVPAFLLGCLALSLTGLAATPIPDPLHNVFGLSSMIGYMAPLAVALSWKKLQGPGRIIGVGWIAFVLIVVTIGLNLSPLFAPDLYPLEYYGVVQRSLFVAFYGWCTYLGVVLLARS